MREKFLSSHSSKLRGFTLIELLIVVAIIAILAAIAVPNFLEAQVRAKVSRAEADLRSYATAIEAYHVDNNKYPSICAPTATCAGGAGPSFLNGPSVFYPNATSPDGFVSSRFIWITTPVAYVTSVFPDPFINTNVRVALAPNGQPNPSYDGYDYVDAQTFYPGNLLGGSPVRGAGVTSGAVWHIAGAGPDGINAFGGAWTTLAPANCLGHDYDPTNGTNSAGDLIRIGSGPGQLYDRTPSVNRVTNQFNVACP